MPLLCSITSAGACTYVWRLTESLPNLRTGILLPEEHQKRLQKVSLEGRLRQQYALFHLLGQLQIPLKDLYYTPQGKPMLRQRGEISVSHTLDYIAVSLAEVPVGVDMEKPQRRMLSLYPKFTQKIVGGSFSEAQLMEYYTRIWTIKEAVYKSSGYVGVNFKQDMHVQPFQLGDFTTQARMQLVANPIKDFLVMMYRIDECLLSVVVQQ